MRSRRRFSCLPLSALLPALLLATTVAAQPWPECGGAIPCDCGHRVVEDTVLTADIGPCPWPEDADELVGLRIDSDVTLDCAGFAVRGPSDARKEEFGIRVGSDSRPVSGAVVRNCEVSGFWWGVYVTESTSVVIEDNYLHDNGWKDPDANGTGYGLDVANSSGVEIARNVIDDNGNEGMHLSHSTDLHVVDNVLNDNGFEQIYFIETDDSVAERNVSRGGTQGLEMRSSSRNSFSYDQWLDSPLQWLEDDNEDNSFFYEDVEGTFRITNGSTGTRLDLVRFSNPGDTCLNNAAGGTVADRPWFADCGKPVKAGAPIVLDRPVRAGKVKGEATILSPGCNADIDGDASVDPDDLARIDAALGTSAGGAGWDPDADLDRDHAVTASDRDAGDLQSGPCPPKTAKLQAKLKRRVVEKTPAGEPDTLLLTAEKSSVQTAPTQYEISVVDRLSGAPLWIRTWGGVEPAEVFDERAYPPGVWDATLTIRDAYWEESRKRKTLKVR